MADEGWRARPLTRGVEPEPLTLFLCGDVMCGRGIDQVLPHSVAPVLYEPYVRDARRYVELAENAHGPIPAPLDFEYPWGEALPELARVGPDLRIGNLETAVTADGRPWEGKRIHYRMHPKNAPLLQAAGLDACSLANNHVLDWGREGLADTLETLEEAGVGTAGAGKDRPSARAPASLAIGEGATSRRVLLFAYGTASSGIPKAWAAGETRSGVSLLADLSESTASREARRIREARREGDAVVVSLHWGGNWGYGIPAAQRRFARRLIDEGAADVIHGHSSHHPKGIEAHRERPILYGCGDFLTDYEGIAGHEAYRDDLVLMYFVTLAPRTDGGLVGLRMTPLRLRRFRLERPPEADVAWLARTLDRECRKLGARVERGAGGRLELRW